MEAMIDAGVHLGFPRDVAIKLVLNTLRGSTGLALESNKSVEELKHMVSISPCTYHLYCRYYPLPSPWTLCWVLP
jgi:pyrroline-5-carboxylate reductase